MDYILIVSPGLMCLKETFCGSEYIRYGPNITAYVSHVQLFPNFGQQEINVAVAQYLGLV